MLHTLDIPEESPSLSHIEPNMGAKRSTPQDMAYPMDSEICQAIKNQSVGPQSASSSFTPPSVSFSSRLSELDTQLAALQNIADYLEKDFSNSRMVNKPCLFLYFLFVLLMTPRFNNWPRRQTYTYCISFVACPVLSREAVEHD